ncbi:MAG: cellobiose phosphorylase, partial [Bacteroidaceae bacterium]|nr:cellobiose phosphorylase [Bacteroidaceae bacterium]
AMLHRLVTTEYGVEVTPTLSFDERGHQVNDTMYFVAAMEEDKIAPKGCFPELGQFLGKAGSFMWPEAVVTEDAKMSPMKGTAVDGQETVGALRFADKELAPKESVTYVVYMGACKKGEKSIDLIAPYMTKKAVDKAFKETKEYWLNKCNVKIHTGDKEFDQFMNWVAFQPELRRLFGCSFLPHHDYGKGGRGWRDLWQDCLALLIMNPENVRSMLLGNFAGVRMDGTNATIIGEKQGEFKADRNSITRVWMDHGVWPMVTTLLYLNQTGDYGILEEPVAYFKDRQVMRGTAIDEEWTKGSGWQLDEKENEYKGSVLEHLLLQNLTAFFEVGEHGNLRLRDADWNDAIDMAGHRGESVAFTNAYAMNLNALADILTYLKDQGKTSVKLLAEMAPLMLMDVSKYGDIKLKKDVLEQYCASCKHTVSGDRVEVSINMLIADIKAKADFLTNHVRSNEWVTDKKGFSYYNSYYDDNGKALKGMMLTGQVFSIMAGTATAEQVEEITKAADNYLYDEACGGYRLNVDFKEIKLDMGRMFGFAYGEKENGAVFSHMCVMYAYSLYQAGFAKEGFKALNALYKQSMNFEASRIYPGVPEYFGKDGRGLYHYLTGAASWYLLTVVTKMFGVGGDKGELTIEPKLTAAQFDENNQASIELVYNNEPLTIVISNPKRLEPSDYKVVGTKRDGNLINVELG